MGRWTQAMPPRVTYATEVTNIRFCAGATGRAGRGAGSGEVQGHHDATLLVEPVRGQRPLARVAEDVF
eukprot:18475-Prorocentrum_minimum.AAC.1